MNNYRKILVAYDGSASSKNALKQAFKLAKWIKVVAVIPNYMGDLDLTAISNIKEVILGPGQKLLAEAKEIAENHKAPILTNLEQGEPYEQIVQVAADENCDLIVMGRRGLSKLERELMGGVTARVIGHTSKDVLVVPENAIVNWGKILLATDGSRNNSAAVDRALELASQHAAELTVVSAVYVNEEFSAQAPEMVNELIGKARSLVDEIKARAEGSGIKLRTVVKEGDPHTVITELAREINADLIVMGSHGRKGLTRLLMGSVTERVIGFADRPVLISHFQK
jgi:nucleotide-binding universal stress UspA family protein